MTQKILAFVTSMLLLLAAQPQAIFRPKQLLPLLQGQWGVLAGELEAYKEFKYDIIIVAGQSNAVGCGLGEVANPFVPRDDIMMMPQPANELGGHSIMRAEEPILEGQPWGNFGLYFARAYVEAGRLAPGRKVLVLQAAVGGTGFSDKRWRLHDDLYRNMLLMIDTALALNPENELKALLWHQGETDAIMKACKTTHKANLKALVNGVRARYNAPNLPFIAGDFVQDWKQDNARICAPVVAAIRAVCNCVGSAAFVETDGLQSNAEAVGNGDDIHFCRAAQYELGARYFEKYQTLV